MWHDTCATPRRYDTAVYRITMFWRYRTMSVVRSNKFLIAEKPGTLLRFALPLMLSGVLQMVYNMVDMVVVGRFVGTQGLSAVSIGGEVMHS